MFASPTARRRSAPGTPRRVVLCASALASLSLLGAPATPRGASTVLDTALLATDAPHLQVAVGSAAAGAATLTCEDSLPWWLCFPPK
jgi:hypothetical protein